VSGADGRHRRDWGESGALFVAATLFAILQERYTIGPPVTKWILGGLVAAMCLLRAVMTAGAALMAAGVALSLIKLVTLVVYHATSIEAIPLLQTAVLIWVGDVVVFATIYHVVGDREFAFPRAEGQPANHAMHFLDYVFLSFTTATAFSPTDTSPLTTRARMLMMVESIISLVVIAIAAARAINILPT
jgi:hypothetical protein